MTERSQTLTVAGQVTVVRLSTFNDVFTLRVKWMKVHDKWRDQFDQSVTKITPEQYTNGDRDRRPGPTP